MGNCREIGAHWPGERVSVCADDRGAVVDQGFPTLSLGDRPSGCFERHGRGLSLHLVVALVFPIPFFS